MRQLAREVRQSSLEKTVKTIRSTKIFEDNRLQTQSGEPDPIEELCGLLKTINSAEQEIMPLVEQANNTPDNIQGIRAIIRRCVGMKEVSNSPVFELYDTKREPAQIGEYIRSFGLDIPNMEREIQQAIDNKRSFEEQGVVFAGDMNAQSALDSIKSFMKRSETSFDGFGKVMSTFEEVAGYYSSNNAETIRMLAGCINGIVDVDICDDTPSDLFNLACNNDIDGFFKLFGRYWSEVIENEESRQNNIKDDKKKLEPHNADAIIGGPAHLDRS